MSRSECENQTKNLRLLNSHPGKYGLEVRGVSNYTSGVSTNLGSASASTSSTSKFQNLKPGQTPGINSDELPFRKSPSLSAHSVEPVTLFSWLFLALHDPSDDGHAILDLLRPLSLAVHPKLAEMWEAEKSLTNDSDSSSSRLAVLGRFLTLAERAGIMGSTVS